MPLTATIALCTGHLTANTRSSTDVDHCLEIYAGIIDVLRGAAAVAESHGHLYGCVPEHPLATVPRTVSLALSGIA